jgi:hypothetical protein
MRRLVRGGGYFYRILEDIPSDSLPTTKTAGAGGVGGLHSDKLVPPLGSSVNTPTLPPRHLFNSSIPSAIVVHRMNLVEN